MRVERKHVKRCSTTAVTREMQIKNTPPLHTYLLKCLKLETGLTKCWQECRATGTPTHLLAGMEKCSCQEELYQFGNQFSSFKLNTTTIWPSHFTLRYHPREMKAYVHTDTFVNVHSSFICNRPKLETTQMSVNS